MHFTALHLGDRRHKCRGRQLPQMRVTYPAAMRIRDLPIIHLHPRIRTSLVHNGVMRMTNKAARQSISLPPNVAAQVRTMARTRRLSANRMLVELIENGIEAEKRKQQEFFDLAERFRSATDPKEVKRLGDRTGRMVFGV